VSNYTPQDLERYAAVFKALSNPHRLRIFLRLTTCCAPGTVAEVEDGCACVGDLGGDLEIAPSTVSHHIKELRNAGLIRVRRNGRKMECWIDPDVLSEIAALLPR